MLAFLRRHSIRWQLIFTGIVILLMLIVIVIWSYYRILDITYERNSVYTQEIITTINQNILSNADTINRIMPNIAYNDTVQQYLRNEDPLARYELYLKLEKLLVNLRSMKQGILEIVLIGMNGNTYNCINCEKDIPLEEIPARTTAYYLGIHPLPAGVPLHLRSTFSEDYVIYVGVPVYDTATGAGTKIGYAIMVLDVNALVPHMDYMSQRITGKFYVTDRKGIIYAGNSPTEIGQPLPETLKIYEQETIPSTFKLNGENSVVHTLEVPEIGSRIISIFPVKELFRGLEDVQALIIGVFALLIAVLILCYIFISRNILLPLRSFLSYIYGIRAKGLESRSNRIAVEGYAEFDVMANKFNSLLDEIDDLVEELIESRTHIFELEILKQQAELRFLKSQINPHFLYNTLETMKGIALARGVREIRDMSDALSRIFRYSIKGEEHVRLQEEIDIIQAYVHVQQIRFEGRFNVQYEFAESTLNNKIIKMILQPLVENAIYHGIEPSMVTCRLVVGSRMGDNGQMIMWVEDDGVGMEAALLNSIRQSLRNQETGRELLPVSPSKHIGIMNVHRRLRIAYGDGYGISSIDSLPNEGTKVTLCIPVKGEDLDV